MKGLGTQDLCTSVPEYGARLRYPVYDFTEQSCVIDRLRLSTEVTTIVLLPASLMTVQHKNISANRGMLLCSSEN